MLIKRRHLEGIATGTITLAFRRWKRPTVRAGGTLRTSIGVLAIDGVEFVTEAELTEADARRAGFASRGALLDELRRRKAGRIYRIELRLSGPDSRDTLRKKTTMTKGEATEVSRRLARLDAASPGGPWTGTVLHLIADHPGTRAADLAALADVEKDRLKRNVRKLKELGLTESLSSGYRLSPRGRTYLRHVGQKP